MQDISKVKALENELAQTKEKLSTSISAVLVASEIAILSIFANRYSDCSCTNFLIGMYLTAQAICGVFCFTFFSPFKARTTDKEKDNSEISESSSSTTRGRKLSIFNNVKEMKVNPFVTKWSLTLAERVNMAVCGSVLMPVRIPLLVVSLVLACLVAKVCCIGMDKEMTVTKPLSPIRRMFLWIVYPLIRVTLFALGFLWIEQKGHPASADEAPVAIANHINAIDAFVLGSMLMPSPIAAAENLNKPLIGNIVRALSTVLVDRNNKESRSKTTEALKTRSRSGGLWPQILIFPEGTTHSDNSLITFKAGAFIPGVPVQPIILEYGRDWDCSWTPDGPSLEYLALRFICTPSNPLSLDFMPVYRPSAEEQTDAKLFASNVRDVMAERMGVSVTAHSFEDIILSRKAAQLHLPVGDTVIEAPRMMKELSVDVEFLKKQMERFAKMDAGGKGYIEFPEFLETMAWPDSPFSRHYFSLMDCEDTGRLNFREFLLGLGMLNSPSMDAAALAKTAFTILDTSNAGLVSIDDISSVLIPIIPQGIIGVEKFDVDTMRKLLELPDGKDSVNLDQWQDMMRRHPKIMSCYMAQVFGEKDI